MSLKKNLLKNGLATLIQKGIKIGEQLLLVPFFISSWGAAYYGEWLTLTIVPTIIGFTNLGFGTAAANYFVLRYADNDKQGASNMAKSGFLTICFIVVLGILFSILLMFILGYYKVFDKTMINKDDAINALTYLMTARIFGFYMQLYEAYYKAARRASLGMNIQSFYSFSTLLGGLLVLLVGGDIVSFSLVTLIITIFFVIIYGVIAYRILPIKKEYKGEVLLSDAKAIVRKGFGYLLSPIWQAVFFQGTTFVVRIVLGPVAVTIFNTVRTLTRAVNQANAMVIASVLPELQFEIGARNNAQARKIFRFGLIMVSIIAFIGIIFLFFGGQWFYEKWTQKAINPPVMMWNIFIIGIFFNALWWLSGDVLIAANKPYEFTIAGLIVAIIAVFTSYILCSYFGLTGAAIGSLIMDVFLFIYVFPRSCKLIDQRFNLLIPDILSDLKKYGKF